MKREVNIPKILHHAGGITEDSFNQLVEYEELVDPKPKRIIRGVFIPFFNN